jgi:hypothetical protein
MEWNQRQSRARVHGGHSYIVSTIFVELREGSHAD